MLLLIFKIRNEKYENKSKVEYNSYEYQYVRVSETQHIVSQRNQNKISIFYTFVCMDLLAKTNKMYLLFFRRLSLRKQNKTPRFYDQVVLDSIGKTSSLWTLLFIAFSLPFPLPLSDFCDSNTCSTQILGERLEFNSASQKLPVKRKALKCGVNTKR